MSGVRREEGLCVVRPQIVGGVHVEHVPVLDTSVHPVIAPDGVDVAECKLPVVTAGEVDGGGQ